MKVNEIWCSICCRYMDEGCKKCDHFDEQVHLNQEDKVDTSPEHLPDAKMTNFDKLLEDPESRRLIMDMAIICMPANFCIDVNNMKIDTRVDCLECEFREKGKDCDHAMIDWLREEYEERRVKDGRTESNNE